MTYTDRFVILGHVERKKDDPQMASSKREQLVDTARRLFYENGIHATGIDKILAEAGVSKMTLYKHFKSKEELVLAAIRRHDEMSRNEFMREVERRALNPLERLLAVFDVLGEWCSMDGFHGCPFINAAAEYGEPESPIRQACAEHNRMFYTYMRDLAAAAGAAEPEELARQLAFLVQGAIVIAYVNGDADAAKVAGNAARILTENALKESVSPPAAASG